MIEENTLFLGLMLSTGVISSGVILGGYYTMGYLLFLF